ncbi:DUF3054 domain-containing protein [Microbacterium xanthum]|uniref:DUF3054 domain-containing protein n=1 Tax=Microbacterium xanthum TaxID=3079794 RepID=UPI002AD4D111|nr:MULTISPECIES: DUF3054 domain-containing protein [unclassified Microbacterium]MDZ8172574.1 DUF3054 domain-containing protein [Microbacterium sp. KSW-48]MDZ8202589.1 DUF3054 domain-containing protein [Microbacterium sp. SSW1-59]
MNDIVETRPRTGALVGAVIADIAVVIAFVALGRASHAEQVWSGLWATALPFLVGLALGWLLARAWRRPLSPLRAGIPVWLATVVGGVLVRAIFDTGTEVSFILVTAGVLLVGLVGWRAVAALARRARTV